MKRLKVFWSDFKKFISRGNVLDLAVAMVVGTAFTKIVSSLVNDIIMPLICAIFGKATVNTLYFKINGAEIYYGKFLQAIIDFLLVAFILFMVLRIIMNASNSFKRAINEYPTRAEKKELKAMGVNIKDRKELLDATEKLRKEKEANKPVEPKKPTTEELLGEILVELKKQNSEKSEVVKEKENTNE